jgi:decaprenylphospho-beta-D-ribofuranose 2-oxidase
MPSLRTLARAGAVLLGALALTGVAGHVLVQRIGGAHPGEPQVQPASSGGYRVTNWGGQYPEVVADIVHPTTEAEVVAAITRARAERRPLTIRGTGHSQGAQNRAAGAIVIDTSDLDQILAVDEQARTVRVQAGATWEEVQRVLAPRGLALQNVQTLNIFSIGGSLASNIHGRDTTAPVLIDSVESIVLITGTGERIEASRAVRPEVFRAAIGGYGLLGVLTEATLRITDDHLCEESVTVVPLDAVGEAVRAAVALPDSAFLHVNLSLRSDRLFEEAYVKHLRAVPGGTPAQMALREPPDDYVSTDLSRFLLELSRDGGAALDARFAIEERLIRGRHGKQVSRNNYMGPAHGRFFLDHHDPDRADFIQEYFIPLDHYAQFARAAADIVRTHDLRPIAANGRYVTGSEALLPYADAPALSFMITLNAGLDDASMAATGAATRALVDAALAANGRYYLTYQLFPTPEQLLAAYPAWPELMRLKAELDPDGLFTSRFHERYAAAGAPPPPPEPAP